MKTAKAYDALPYPSKFFAQTYPDRLATLGRVFGIDAKPPNKCRVLELGCGNGSNLISHAYNLSGSEFVGVDISPEHIREAEESKKTLGLENIEFRELNLLEMETAEFGEFDYITAHGLISWIPDFVREKVFSIFAEMLTPHGIGYASYNAYPGAHYRDMVRGMMRYHTAETEDPREKVRESISFLALLAENSGETKIYQPILEHELKRHFRHGASDIYHDDLADEYRPFYISEFADVLETNKLQFLCEAELHAMSIQNFPPAVQELLMTKENIIEREQYLDFFLGRIFRQTLFCRKEVSIERRLDPTLIDSFFVASSVKPAQANPQTDVAKPERFIGSKGFGMEIDHPPTKTALKILGENWGKAIASDKLLQTVRQELEKSEYSTADWEKEFDITRAILFQVYQGTDLLELRSYQTDGFQEVSEKPEASRLSRWQVENADNVTTHFYINIQIDDEVSRNLIRIADGTRRREQLLSETVEFIKNSDQVENKQELLSGIENWLDESLRQLAELGLFVS